MLFHAALTPHGISIWTPPTWATDHTTNNFCFPPLYFGAPQEMVFPRFQEGRQLSFKLARNQNFQSVGNLDISKLGFVLIHWVAKYFEFFCKSEVLQKNVL